MEQCEKKCYCHCKFWLGILLLVLLGVGVWMYVCGGKRGCTEDCSLVQNAKDHLQDAKEDSKQVCRDMGEMGKDLKEDMTEAFCRDCDAEQ